MTGHPPRILVADDSPTARDIYGTYLRHAGYTVLEAEDGAAALERIRTERPDVVILDMFLPRLDGLEVMRRIRDDASLRDTPIICVTAAMTDDYHREASDLGCAAFLEKPDSPGRIAGVVEGVLEERGAGGDGSR